MDHEEWEELREGTGGKDRQGFREGGRKGDWQTDKALMCTLWFAVFGRCCCEDVGLVRFGGGELEENREEQEDWDFGILPVVFVTKSSLPPS